MSRIGKIPIILPSNLEVIISPIKITINGPLGSLTRHLSSFVKVTNNNNVLNFKVIKNTREGNAMFGTFRALVNNMIIGVTKGFEKKLNLIGVGFRAQVEGNTLNLSLGFSHPIIYKVPQNIECKTLTQTEILLKGIDRQVVGQVAAEIRSYRQPEPYKGKGVRYSDEIIVLKETKKK